MKPKRAILPGRCRAYLSPLELADWDKRDRLQQCHEPLLTTKTHDAPFSTTGAQKMCVAVEAHCFRFWNTQRPLWGWIRADHSVKGRLGWRMRWLSLAADRPGNHVVIQQP